MKKNNIILLALALCFCIILPSFAQDAKLSVYDVRKTATDNPQFTLRTFFENMDKENYNPEIAIKTMDFGELRNPNRKSLAIKLKKIFDAKGVIIIHSKISLDPNYVDTVSMTQVYYIAKDLPDIYLEKSNGKWMFSAYSVTQIQTLYNKIFPFDSSIIVDQLPDFFKYSFLGVELWQYLGLAIFLFLSLLIYYILRFLSKFFLNAILNRISNWSAAKTYVIPISARISKLLGLLIFMAVLPTLELPHKFNFVIVLIIKILIPILIVLIAFRIIDAISAIFQRVSTASASTVDEVLVPFIRKGLKILFFIFAVFYALDTLNINITPLLAGVSIGGLAFALAAQDTVKNLFGSLTIFADQPFAVGDWVILANEEGTIEEIGLRSTRIRTFEDSIITVPNGKLMDMVIDNMGRRNIRRYKFLVQITNDTPKDKILQFIEGIRELMVGNSDIYQDNIQVSFFGYNNAALEIRIALYFTVEDFQHELKAREAVNIGIYELAEKIGVRFAFPSQSIYIEKNSENNS